MKFNLKNLPLHPLARNKKDYCPICVAQKKWFDGFEKELGAKIKQLEKERGTSSFHTDLINGLKEVLGE